MSYITRSRLYSIIAYAVVLTLSLVAIRNALFWDTVQLASKHATFFLSTGLSELVLPDAIDSGHIPAFGYSLAVLWSVFGRTLEVSHLFVLPFSFGIVWQLHLLVRRYVPSAFTSVAVLFVLLDPTLMSQMTLVSPDIPLVFFFLWCANGILDNRRWAITVSILLLFLVSMRGAMVAFCLLLFDLYCNVDWRRSLKSTVNALFRRSLLYIPAMAIFLAYMALHHAEKGWVLFNPDSPWSEGFELVGLQGLFRNVAVLGWYLVDFGRIAIWVLLIYLLFRLRKTLMKDRDTRELLFLTGIFLIVLPGMMIWGQGLIIHRYLLPAIILVAILTMHLLSRSGLPVRVRGVLLGVSVVILLTGNLWVYPRQIAQGWDSTLAHLPYYGLRNEALAFIQNEDISPWDCASFFPNLATMDEIDLGGDHRRFAEFDGKNAYVLYSNVFNISDQDLAVIDEQYDSRT